jgi:hypothetical protein
MNTQTDTTDLQQRLAKALGKEPVTKWRFWYSRKDEHWSGGYRTKEEAESGLTLGKKSWPDIESTDPEPYDCWDYLPSLLDLIREGEGRLIERDLYGKYALRMESRCTTRLNRIDDHMTDRATALTEILSQ